MDEQPYFLEPTIKDQVRAYAHATVPNLRFACIELRSRAKSSLFLCGACTTGKFAVAPYRAFFSAGPCPHCGAIIDAVTQDGRSSVQVIDVTYRVDTEPKALLKP